MNNSQLDGLIALKMVAEKRNFAAAANALGISPSAISQIIKQSLKSLLPSTPNLK
jgi:DNA-binding transcriptional LysR family regulator